MSDRLNRPAGPLLHPVALLSVAVLLLNDHVLKPIAPGLVTGKISDVAGLIFFPLLIASVVEVVASLTARQPPRRRVMPLAAVVTVLGFTLVKTTPLGADAFAWALGLGQWFVLGGPIRDLTLAPTAVVVDPTDLIALPAVLVAWAIGRTAQTPPRLPLPTPAQRGPSRVATLMVVVAGLASLATSPAMANANVLHEEIVRLTRDQPVVTRHLLYDVTNRDPTVTSVTMNADVSTVEIQNGINVAVAPGNVEFTLAPDPPATGVRSADEEFGSGPLGHALDLTEACSRGCHGGVTAIIRLTGGAAAPGSDIHLRVDLWASTDHEGGSVDADLALRSEDGFKVVGQPSSLVVTTQRTIRVGTVEGSAHVEFTLRISPEALRAPLEFPLVGRVITSVTTIAASGDVNAHQTWVSVGAGSQRLLGDDFQPFDVDWLKQCQPAAPCEVIIGLASDYDPMMNSEDFDPADPAARGFVELRWSVEARLEAFDGRALPEGALTFVEP
jgi:hypothetical protein